MVVHEAVIKKELVNGVSGCKPCVYSRDPAVNAMFLPVIPRENYSRQNINQDRHSLHAEMFTIY